MLARLRTLCLMLLSLPCALTAQSVPLQRWTTPARPTGVDFGFGYGIAVGDYDGDGFPDVYQAHSGNLWRNVAGTDWQLARNLNSLLPPASFRYSSSFADYDLDGRVDIAIEPYNSECLRLLRNLDNAGGFAEVAGLAAIVAGQPCGVRSETICWGDVDGDGWLDFILPTYPTATAGNTFFHSLGPTGPGGAVRFLEMATAAGLRTTPWCVRPEGAELIDIDRDGDLDFYCNGTLYQNRSRLGQPAFAALTMPASGILYGNLLDEGALMVDYDMDGDFDLLLQIWSGSGVMRVFENRGDSTFFEVETGVVDQPSAANTGLSAEDWDNDGDTDVTNSYVMRRNDFVETGARRLTVAPHAMPELFPGANATPCWLDWDKDGDMDCVLGKHNGNAIFYRNTLYGPTTPLRDRRYVRVRPARDAVDARGCEVEFGARVEIVLHNPAETRRRTRVVTSAGGYLNQSEYTAHFGLPANVPFEDLWFDVVVEFPSLEAAGVVRVDPWVNPALGGSRLATLWDREITVLRSGRVRINGVDLPPAPGRAAAMLTTNGQLPLPTTTLPAAVGVAFDTWVGTAVDTLQVTEPLRLREVVVDGQFAVAGTCGGTPCNLALLEIQNGAPLGLVAGSATVAVPSPRNRRTFTSVDWQLLPGREYAVVARVTQQRAAPAVADGRGLRVQGALSFQAADPCAVVQFALDPAVVRVWLRYSKQQPGGFVDVGRGIAGQLGVPSLVGASVPTAGQVVTLWTKRALPGSLGFLIAGRTPALTNLLGGVLVPWPDVIAGGYLVEPDGAYAVDILWPPDLPAAFFQMVVLDPTAPFGFAASNALLGGVW